MPTKLQEFETKYKHYKERYDNGDAVITDDEFDAFEELGKQLFPNSDVFDIIGMEDVVKIQHIVPMMSLDKYRELINLIKWLNKRQAFISFKMDGCAVSLKYLNGNLIHGATRGNGFYGQDITRALSYIKLPNIPDFDIEVRGELVISKDNFEKLNVELKKRNLNKAKSRRNIIPGLISSVRTADFDLAKYVDFVAYDVLGDSMYNTESEKFDWIKGLGFKTSDFGIIKGDADVNNMIEHYKKIKDGCEYLTDGLVITLNDISTHEMTDRNPKHKVAFKLANEVVSTIVKDIEVKTSGNGIVTFVGIVEPVEMNEATISRVTLHNANYIKNKNINIGATIGITRSGDIIPTHVTTYIPNGTYETPTNCPTCNSELHRDGAFLMCENQECAARKIGKIEKWIKVIDVKGVSGKTIESLYNANVIRNTSDLYRLRVEDIEYLEGFGRSSAVNIIGSIKKASTSITEDMLIRGSNVRNIGKTCSKVLIERYGNVPNMCETMNYHELEHIDGVGEETATLILRSKDIFCSFYREMSDVIDIKTKVKDSDKLNGKSFCITGTLSKGRDEFKNIVEMNGGIVRSSVSKKLDYLLAGASAGSKLAKAEKCEVTILSEEDFLKLINVN